MKPTLYLMMGLPGAGKSTAASYIEQLTGAVRLSSDEARLMIWPEPAFTEEEHRQLYEYLDEQTELLLKSGKSVVYDANLNRFEHRKEKYSLAAAVGAQVKLCWIQTPSEIALERRISDFQHHKLVPSGEDPESMFHRIAKSIEQPNDTESFISFDGTKINQQTIDQALSI